MARIKFVVHERTRAFKEARAILELQNSGAAGVDGEVRLAPGVKAVPPAPREPRSA